MENDLITNQKIISYLTFKLGKEVFAINVGNVINILELVEITRVPKMPDYMAGIINLRGEVLPLLDANLKLGKEKSVFTNSTCILVVETRINGKNMKFGVLVDSVQEVVDVEDEQILPPPEIGTHYSANFITGVIQNGDMFTMLVDIHTFLTENELVNMNQIKKSQKVTDEV